MLWNKDIYGGRYKLHLVTFHVAHHPRDGDTLSGQLIDETLVAARSSRMPQHLDATRQRISHYPQTIANIQTARARILGHVNKRQHLT